MTGINTNNEVVDTTTVFETPDEVALRLAKELEKTQIDDSGMENMRQNLFRYWFNPHCHTTLCFQRDDAILV